jgi:alkylated DNA nucleotide flippase Atl1
MRIDPEEYVELVLTCVEQIPRGRVSTYGAIAEAVGEVAGGGGPRQVGSIMASYGGPVPWWRVVRADGSLPPSHQGEARQAYLEEGTPLRPSGHVDIGRALFRPRLDAPSPPHQGGRVNAAGPGRPSPGAAPGSVAPTSRRPR